MQQCFISHIPPDIFRLSQVFRQENTVFPETTYYASFSKNDMFFSNRHTLPTCFTEPGSTSERGAKIPRQHTKHMNITQHLLDLSPRPKLRLSEIERLIRKHRIIVPPPSRRKLNAMCENGTFETPARQGQRSWLVYEDSFLEWVKSLDEDSEK